MKVGFAFAVSVLFAVRIIYCCLFFLGNVAEGFKFVIEILPRQAVIFNDPKRLGSVVDRAGLGWPPLVSGDAGMIAFNLFD